MALHFLLETCSQAQPGDTVALTGAEAKHAAVVRRVRIGETVTIGDGQGVWLTGEVSHASPSDVQITVNERRADAAPTARMILAQALAKGDRDELAVQAACELGIDDIVPWQASRSVSRWEGPKAKKGRERWQSIVREAAKQAHRSWVPQVTEPCTTAELVARSEGCRILVLEPTATLRLSEVARDERSTVLIVGPEGGIDAKELERFAAAGAQCVRLGDTVLRTSTAGPAAIAVLSAATGRW